MITAIVFDFDGVLADSEPLHFRALREMLASLGVALSAEHYYSTYVGYDDVGVFRLLEEEQGWGLDEEKIAALIAEKSRMFEDMVAAADVLFPTAIPCIERLGAQYPLGIASGALKHEIQHILRRHRLEDRFRFIVASGDTPRSKPSPDPYTRAAELHGLPPSACLAIEDSKWGIEAAKTAGLKCVGITTTYDAESLPGADAIINSLDEFTVELIHEIGKT
ncbi:MAG: HAD family phosphatase [Acidobacteria bacterium]|nr:HAD family phosphatase [Acidobacteriota bacterium]